MKATLISLFFIATNLCTSSSNAQKLPSVQTASLRLAANTKIDGKANEWDDKFQAFNKATELYYMIANDDNNLYLSIQSDRPRVIQKMIYVGVTLVVGSIDNKKKDNGVAITYPLLSPNDGMMIIANGGAKADLKETTPGRLPPDADTAKTHNWKIESDSLTRVANAMIDASAKSIKVKGVPEITDTLISIYNEEGIKVASKFNNKKYTCELLIPLKYLGLSKQSLETFSYRIKLNSRWVEPKKGILLRYYYPVPGAGPVTRDPDFDATTYLDASYSLAH